MGEYEDEYQEPAPEPASTPVADEDRVRYEDDPNRFPAEEGFEPAELSAPEVPLEESRKDETTLLATDQ